MICLPTAHRGLSLLLLSVAACCYPAYSVRHPASSIQYWQLLHFPRIYQPVSVSANAPCPCPPHQLWTHISMFVTRFFPLTFSISSSQLPLSASASTSASSLFFLVGCRFRASDSPLQHFYFVRFNFYYMRLWSIAHVRLPSTSTSTSTSSNHSHINCRSHPSHLLWFIDKHFTRKEQSLYGKSWLCHGL